ncbi:hypothetical protein L6250_00580 [Candidatus Parcubacteria bacterium]|nr:hypothetical protein [Patescibacteria group bacterium]MBU4466821.1 hypothetical protein [Patescibacteria group bacterium]MCG2688124.1 hypothetical protein [Candidatus Parcubacteria bacterium]
MMTNYSRGDIVTRQMKTIKTKKRRLSKSTRKFIRREKGRIRSQVFDLEEQKKQISEVHRKFSINKSK